MKKKSTRMIIALLITIMTISLLSVSAPTEASAASTGYVTAGTLTVRSRASKTSKALGYYKKGTKVTIKGTSGDFYKISYNGGTAYISKKYVSSSSSGTTPTTSSKGQQIASYATQFVGNPYRWGGTSLTNGADCSGFILSVYKKFGYSLPHSSSALRSRGRAVSYSNKQAGDVVCYKGHVALYIGNNKIVHAANTRRGIIISNISYMSVVCIRRII